MPGRLLAEGKAANEANKKDLRICSIAVSGAGYEDPFLYMFGAGCPHAVKREAESVPAAVSS